MNPKVSIIMPAYNCESYISNSIESILNQTYKELELIIINDGSNDSTENIIKKYRQTDSRIIYHYQKNQGPSAARNTGILNARGEFIAFIDSDDTVNEKYIESLLLMMNRSNADIVCCGYIDISKYGEYKHNDFLKRDNFTTNEFLRSVCQGTGGVLWSKLFRKKIIKKHNILLDNDIYMCEDLIFVLKYAQQCTSFIIINEYLYNYNRLNDKSISSNISPAYIENYIKVWERLKEILEFNLKDKNVIEDIIREKVQAVSIKMVEQQCYFVTKTGFIKVFTILNKLLKNYYLLIYKSNFKTNKNLYRPLIFFMKNNLITMCIIYGVNLILLKKLYNFKLSIRKIVNI